MRNESKFITVKPNNMADISTELTQEFKPGEIAILDGEHEVIVLEQTHGRIRTIIYGRKKTNGTNGLWRVMTYRLSRKQLNVDAGKVK